MRSIQHRTARDTLKQNVDRMSYTQRLAVTLLAIFGGMALFLAAIGLYAVMSYSVSQSTRELGLRMALGATVRDLLQLVISRGLRLTIAGIVIGAGGGANADALAGQHALQSESARSDRVRHGIDCFLAVALVACFLPRVVPPASIPRARCERKRIIRPIWSAALQRRYVRLGQQKM